MQSSIHRFLTILLSVNTMVMKQLILICSDFNTTSNVVFELITKIGSSWLQLRQCQCDRLRFFFFLPLRNKNSISLGFVWSSQKYVNTDRKEPFFGGGVGEIGKCLGLVHCSLISRFIGGEAWKLWQALGLKMTS